MLVYLRFWREGLIGILLILIFGLLVRDSYKDMKLAESNRAKAQLQLIIDALERNTQEAISQQRAQDSKAEKAAIAHQKRIDAINNESIPEECEHGKDWAIIKAMEFSQDR